ncbi:MAG: HvfC/BufC family peptide modification chaperone, partial [Gammaproteobacteria bacterium]
MPSLLEVQSAFVRGVFDPADAAVAELIVPGGSSAGARLAVYQRNALGNYGTALRDVFPVLLRLVGEPFFDQLARAYATQTPSCSGDLHDFGAELGAFLEALPAARDLPYLADVARLEWAVHRTFHGRHTPALDAARLAAVPPERLPDLRFELHPAARLLRSPYPVLTIWHVNQPQWTGDQAVDLGLG